MKRQAVVLFALLFFASNEPKSVLARDLGDCRGNLRNSQSAFLIVVVCDKGEEWICLMLLLLVQE